jgi:hypothetical protein
MVNGVRLRLLSLRGSWVQIPSPAPVYLQTLFAFGIRNLLKITWTEVAAGVNNSCMQFHQNLGCKKIQTGNDNLGCSD